jgi:hypothetical protein
MYKWIALLIIGFAGVAFGQVAGNLSYGDTVNGTITDEDPIHDWTFEGSTGDVIFISLEAAESSAGGLDAFLQLLDPQGNLLQENDDASATTVNSAIEAFSLPVDGTYTIRASRFGLGDGLSEGDYNLTLTLGETGDTPSETPSEDSNPIAYNETVSGTLNRQNFEDAWTFSGQAGDLITIRMTRVDEASDLDSFVRLLSESDEELGRNDDGPEGIQTAEIIDFELPSSGTYTIIATRYGFESGTSTGDYSLEILTDAAPSQQETLAPTVEPVATEEPVVPEETATPEAPTAQPPTAALPLEVGQAVEGSLGAGEIVQYQFEEAPGTLVTISIKRAAGDLNPLIRLLDEAGNVLAENLEFNGSADARIAAFELPTAERYFVQVEGENGSAGDFVLRLFLPTEVETTVQPSVPETEPTTEPETPASTPVPQVDVSGAALAVVLSWSGTADFDLAVIEPSGDRLDYGLTSSSTGGVFGGDANGGCTSASPEPSETAYWETEAPTGDFVIEVAHVFPCEDESPVSYTVTVTLGGEVIETFEGELSEGGFITYDVAVD